MSAQLKANITAEQFSKFGVQMKGWGAVDKIGDPVVRDMGPLHLITFPVSFASQNINFPVRRQRLGFGGAVCLCPGPVDLAAAALQQTGFLQGTRR